MDEEIKKFLKIWSIGSAVTTSAIILGYHIANHYVNSSRDTTEARGYVSPGRFEVKSVDMFQDGNKKTIASYHGINYLFRLGTNGVPYLQPIRGLENEVGER